jgi:hypothetical protein
MSAEPGVRFGIANAVLVAALYLAAAARLDVVETELLTVLVAGLASAGLSLAMTASISVVAWALLTGFVENRYGELTFTQGDVLRLALFAVSTIVLALLAHWIHVAVARF